MADTVTLPGGKKANKWVVIAVAVGGSIAAYLVYRSHEASASGSGTAAGTITDPSTGISYSATATDPVTGLTYAQEIGEYGSVETADQDVSSGVESDLYDEGDLYGTGYNVGDYSTGAYGSGTTTSGSIYTSNSAWSQAVTAGLTDIGYTATDVSAALGEYLTGTPVSADAAAIIQAAIAEYGAPPVGTYQIIPASGTSTTTTTTSSTKATEGYPGPTDVSVKHTSGTSYTVSWKTIQGTTATGPTPTSYTVAINNAATGAQVIEQTVSTPDAAGATGTVTFSLPAVTKTTRYNGRVWANGTTGIAPKNATFTITET